MARARKGAAITAAGQAAETLAAELGPEQAATNQPDISVLDRLALGDIAELPAETLAAISEQVEKESAKAKARAGTLRDAIGLKYRDKLTLERGATKLFGRARVADGEWSILEEIKKNVSWDQAMLKALWLRIAGANDDPEKYIHAEYSVKEATYNDATIFSEPVKALFEPARTVKPGPATYKIEIKY